MHVFAPERLPTARQARRSLIVGGIVLALAVTLSVVALPLGIRGHGVARLGEATAAPGSSTGPADERPGAVELRTAPIASLTRDASATVELVDGAASRARLSLLRDGAWVDGGDRLALSRDETAAGVTVRVRAVAPRDDREWDGIATVRLTVSQGFLPDVDEVDIDLFAS